ncbi:MAG: nicotinate-nucleotide diphosphorylase (carboxylating) [Spirochaetes bacterium GWF1_51_8]|nr:MAG: nicotinate-nucleotide diphosphorylase (carboxylating) [Spirochaetes bacterium GWF1_51_8]
MASKREGLDFPKRIQKVSPGLLKDLIEIAVREDLDGIGDITTQALFKNISEDTRSARVTAKERGVVCGIDVALAVYSIVSNQSGVEIMPRKLDGEIAEKGETILTLKGRPSGITTGERIALNFMGILSGVATKTRRYADLISGSSTRLLDTRKTLPGMRELQKYAVATGGGYNHRMGLYDMILIKDNHISAVRSLTKAVELAKAAYPFVPIEVETTTIEQVAEAVETEADILMLDNMNNDLVREALRIIGGSKYIEVSGNVDEKRLVELAGIGADFVSMGELTHTVKPLDLSLLFDE